MKPVVVKNLGAPIVTTTRCQWVLWPFVRSSRREAKKDYLQDIDPMFHKDALSRVRFARVTVMEQVK